MTKFDKFRRDIYIVISVTTSFLIPFFIDALQEIAQLKHIATFIGIVAAVVLLVLVSIALEALIDNSVWLRKWISRGSFIEGYWYDVTLDKNKIFYHMVILCIEYEEGKYVISGETFNKTSQVALFKTFTTVDFSNNDLLFQTEGNYLNKGTYKSLVSIKFNTAGGKYSPSSYNGFYIDYTSQSLKPNDIAGTRISDKDLKKYNSFEFVSDKLNFVKKLAADGVI